MPGSQSASSRFAVTPTLAAAGRLGWARGAFGAALGILLTGFISRWAMGSDPALPWLMAPMGASAVLMFVFPASPLAQPWPLIGGNLLSAALGLVVHAVVKDPLLAAAIALAGAIGLMTLARCLHPPGGACALLGAMGNPAMDAMGSAGGWHYLAVPLTINIVVLLTVGFLFNNLTGHRYPHHPKPGPVLTPGTWAGSYTDEDLDAVLADWDEVLDVSREDLDALFRQVERRVQRKWLDDLK